MAEKSTGAKSPLPNTGDHDRVTMASRRADGTADQTPDYEFIGDKETSIAATKTQLGQQAASAVDAAERRPAGDEGNDMDPEVAELKAKIDGAVETAEAAGEAEVEKRFATDESRTAPSSTSSSAASGSSK